jgi:hypothetical protein
LTRKSLEQQSLLTLQEKQKRPKHLQQVANMPIPWHQVLLSSEKNSRKGKSILWTIQEIPAHK